MEIKLWLIMALSVGHVAAHPHGAPTTACDSMFPLHKHDAQKSSCPYITKPEQIEIFSNMSLSITLQPLDDPSSNVDHFNGFMIMAFDKSSPVAAIGSFQVSDDRLSHTIDCHGGFENTATHSSKAHKTLVRLSWTPPENFEGEIVFKTTYVESKKIYWVKVLSEPVKVISASTEIQPTIDRIVDLPYWTDYVSLWAVYCLTVILFAGGLSIAIAIRSTRSFNNKKAYSTLQETISS